MELREAWGRPDVRFLVVFLLILGTAFTLVALRPVNDAFVEPYTALVARGSGVVLQLLEPGLEIRGQVLASPRFAVTIYNGCNGLITSLIFVSGVLAFPAAWRAKAAGVAVGLVAIQLINLIRIVSLFYIGVFLPELFNEAHVFVWQSIVILFGVVLWIVWARRSSVPGKPA